MYRNSDLITLRNGQYNRSKRSRAVKRLDIQTLIKVGGGSNPIFFFLRFFFSFDAMAKQSPYRYSTDAKRLFKIPMTFASERRKTGLRYH